MLSLFLKLDLHNAVQHITEAKHIPFRSNYCTSQTLNFKNYYSLRVKNFADIIYFYIKVSKSKSE